MSKYYIYQHIGNKSNKPFYVGMSTNVHGDFVRMKDSKNRTPEWMKVVKDEKGFTYEVVEGDLNHNQASLLLESLLERTDEDQVEEQEDQQEDQEEED